jgi:hypothetical protein
MGPPCQCERSSSLLDMSSLQVGPNGQIQCQSAKIDRLVHIAKKTPVNLRHFAIQTKTCGFPKFERKCRGFMLTTPLSTMECGIPLSPSPSWTKWTTSNINWGEGGGAKGGL